MKTRLCVLSDTHNMLNRIEIPKCSIMIHCGDSTMTGSVRELERFANDLTRVRDKYEICLFVAGNHEIGVEKDIKRAREILVDLLCHRI